jgi:hypothetical protein
VKCTWWCGLLLLRQWCIARQIVHQSEIYSSFVDFSTAYINGVQLCLTSAGWSRTNSISRLL